MDKLVILCVEDEPEVRDAVVRDLETFAGAFRIEVAEDVPDAREVMQECEEDGDAVALVLCDHILPGEYGVEFLVELNKNPTTAPIRKVLLTGQAGLEDTVRAVNEGDLHHYLAKPWSLEDLHQVVRDQLTSFVIEDREDLLPFVQHLDGPRLLEAIKERGSDR